MTSVRKIIRIDEEKCDGCGQCVPSCAEGAIEIVNGKARLVSDTYCDGLGNCLGVCPQDAITIEEREAEGFDVEAAETHLAEKGTADATPAPCPGAPPQDRPCPGARMFTFTRQIPQKIEAGDSPSQLTHWPVKLILSPPKAPHYDGATLVLAADCAPFAYADFHRRFLAGRPLLTACPKFGKNDVQRSRLADIFRKNDVRSVEVLHMEVPCCTGLVRLARQALADAGKDIPVRVTKISIRGEVLESEPAPVSNEADTT